MPYLPGNLKLISAQAPTVTLLRKVVGGHYPAPEAFPKEEAPKWRVQFSYGICEIQN